jgi:hypothetical protein
MSNVAFGYPNLADEATLIGGSWTSTLPVTHMQKREIKRIARTTNAANSSTKFIASYAKSQLVKLLVLCNHNISLDGSYRIKASDDSGFSTLLYDSGVVKAWEPFYPTSELAWEDENWFTGQPRLSDIAGYTWNLTHILPYNVKAKYWSIEIFDSTNVAGFIEIGRLFISRLFQPLYNMNWGASIKYEDATIVTQNPYSGREFFAPIQGARNVKLTLDLLSDAEAVARVLDMQRILGIHGEVFFIWDPADARFRTQRSFLARMQSLDAIEAAFIGANKSAFDLKELI